MIRMIMISLGLLIPSDAWSQSAECEKIKLTKIPFSLYSKIQTRRGEAVSIKLEEMHVHRNEHDFVVNFVGAGPIGGPYNVYSKTTYTYGRITAAFYMSQQGQQIPGSEFSYSPPPQKNSLLQKADFSVRSQAKYFNKGGFVEKIFVIDYQFLSEDFSQVGSCRMRVLKYEAITRASDQSMASVVVSTYSPELGMFLSSRLKTTVPNGQDIIVERNADRMSLDFAPFPGE